MGEQLGQVPVAPRAGGRSLIERYRSIRSVTEALASPLSAEDCVIQSMPDVSPTKWHLAHTSWFFETFVLAEAVDGYACHHPSYGYLFNSYYEAVGPRHCRPRRGLLSRPTLDEVLAYRREIDECMIAMLKSRSESALGSIGAVIETGLHHEQQHQELILTDIKHVFSQNPLEPAYQRAPRTPARAATSPMKWQRFAQGLYEIGHGKRGFCFDNERPRHQVYLESFELSNRLVTNGEYEEFIEDGGYRTPSLWLSDGWAAVQAGDWQAPLYWRRVGGGSWTELTLGGRRPIAPAEPVCHLSYYEADAFARWAGARLPTEAEWEVAASQTKGHGQFLETGRYHPAPVEPAAEGSLVQLLGDAWEWTQSAYSPYPGYTPPPGALGEYNGKFMCSQMVLRGGSCATPRSHIRATYRNFFPPDAQWQFSGMRLARDAR